MSKCTQGTRRVRVWLVRSGKKEFPIFFLFSATSLQTNDMTHFFELFFFCFFVAIIFSLIQLILATSCFRLLRTKLHHRWGRVDKTGPSKLQEDLQKVVNKNALKHKSVWPITSESPTYRTDPFSEKSPWFSTRLLLWGWMSRQRIKTLLYITYNRKNKLKFL